MKLSIITCTYNSEKYIQETIDSVIWQNLNKDLYEHIFIDGFSTDNTIDILDKYKKSNIDKNITILQKQAKWIYNAMNTWINVANWEYLLFLHSDDFLEKNSLNEYLDFILQTWNKDFYYARRNSYFENKKQVIWYMPSRSIYKKWFKNWLIWFVCYVMQPSVISKKELHTKYWYYNENLKIVSDWEFFIILAQNNVEAIFYDKAITNFRIHETSISTGNVTWKDISEKEEIYIINKYYKRFWFIYRFVKKTYRILFY